jgi:hypothetical protein
MKRAWIALTVAAVVAGCGGGEDPGRASGAAGERSEAPADPVEAPAGWREHVDQRRGFRVALPPGWDLADPNPAHAGGDPVEILLAATYPLGESQGLCRSLGGVPPDQAILNLQERGLGAYGGPSFPPRPATFEPDPSLPGSSTWPYCISGDHERPIPMLDYWFGFGDAGRAFHVFVGVGREAPDELRHEAFAILDTLRFDPDVKPDWQSAG